MINKEHLIQEGLLKLVAIKGSLNLGLAPELQSAFPMVINADKPIFFFKKKNWISSEIT
jgi:hypothetical protein